MVRKVHPGSKLSIRASEWNAAQAAGEAYKHAGKFGGGSGATPKTHGIDVTFINPSSTDTYKMGEVVWLGAPAPRADQNEDEYLSRMVHYHDNSPTLTSTLREGYPYTFGIALDSIPEQGSGRVRIAGVANVKIDATYANEFSTVGTFVLPMPKGDKPLLFSSGPMELLYRDLLGTVSDQWARVRFPVQMPDILCRATKDIAADATYANGDLVITDESTPTPVDLSVAPFAFTGYNRTGTFVMTDDLVRIRRVPSTTLSATGSWNWTIVSNETHQGIRDGEADADVTSAGVGGAATINFTTATGNADTIQATALTEWTATNAVVLTISPSGKATAAKAP